MTGQYYRAEDFSDVQRPPQPPDNFVYLVPVDDEIHTVEQPFCPDPTCDCHDDADEIGLVAQYVERGLLTPEEATDYVAGRKV